MTNTDRARAYLAKLPPAVAGQGGHAATFNAACRCVEFGLSFDEALPVLANWNQTQCKPTWTDLELRHKLADAFKKSRAREEFAAGRATDSRKGVLHSASQGQYRRETASASFQPEKRRTHLRYEPLCRSGLVDGTGEKPRSGCQISLSILTLVAGSAAQFAALATLRGISAEAVALASARGLLRFGCYWGRAAWFILDSSQRIVQARRLDGRNFFGDVKALNLSESQAAWPVGIGEAQSFPAVALCEGGADLLAAHHFIWLENREHDCAAVAMLGGCARIHADAVPLFAGKRVRIFPHVDDTGERAVNRWAKQLAGAGATVDAFSLAGLHRADGAPVKDLCDLAAIHADDFEAHRCLWELFDYARPA